MNEYRITIVTELVVNTNIGLMENQDEWQRIVEGYKPATLPFWLHNVEYYDGSITIEEVN
jgi:hypothetical protein